MASVSRAHARLEIRDKVVRLAAETDGALTAINGQRVHPEKPQDLQPQDVIQFGELLFRWEREERAFLAVGAKLRLRALGAYSVSLGAHDHDELEFRNENAKNLLFRLASCRDSELGIERILEQYWPERPPLRQRKNLSHTLKALQNELGWSEATFSQWISRSSDTLRLSCDAVESYDVWELQDSVRRSRRQALALSELPELHRGPLLPYSQNAWAGSLRVELFLGWLRAVEVCAPQPEVQVALAETITRCLRDGDFEEFIYEKAFQVAARLGFGVLAQQWLSGAGRKFAHDSWAA